MSGIIITEYDGDSSMYDEDQSDEINLGEPVDRHEYGDFEELDAIAKMVELTRDAKHFDVRHWVN